MKNMLILVAMLCATVFAHAQDTTSSNAQTASQAGAISGAAAAGNVINFGSTPAQQTLNENVSVQTRAEQVLSGTQTLKNVPAIAMSGPASGPCTGISGGIGIAGPGWGLGANGSAVMVDCRLRENTRVLGMAMQSVDGGASPQEKGELMVLFMDAARGLAAYNAQILGEELAKKK